MICISKREREELEQVGLLQHKRTGFNACDANFTVVNRENLGRSKKTYLVEDEKILLYLGRYDGLNLQKVSERQVNQLLKSGEITEEQVQKWKEYKPAGICYQDYEGHWRMRKIPKLMISLGIWKTGGNKVNNTERTDEVEQ